MDVELKKEIDDFFADLLQKWRSGRYKSLEDLMNTEINPRAITQKWDRHVKKVLDIDEDFYSLKHLFLDKLDSMQGQAPIINIAQGAAGHTTDRTTGIYTVGRKSRAVEHLKTLPIT